MEDLESIYKEGLRYFNGDGVIKDYSRAFKNFSQVGMQKYFDAYYYLGYCYENGLGVVKNLNQACLWYKNGADEDDLKSIYALGNLYYKMGEYSLAESYLIRCVEDSNVNAMIILAKINVQNKDIMLDYLNRAAKLNSSDAFYELGLYYLDINSDDAVKFLSKSYELGEIKSAYVLGYEYYYGKKLKLNYDKAYYWLSKAHTHEIKEASYLLCGCYYYGYGTNKNDKKCQEILEVLANKNDSNACCYLAGLYFDTNSIVCDYYLGRYWYEKGANLGNVSCMRKLAECYLEKKGCDVRNIERAYYWFNEAYKYGDNTVVEELARFKKNIFGKYIYK